jgi:hypothetical protein
MGRSFHLNPNGPSFLRLAAELVGICRAAGESSGGNGCAEGSSVVPTEKDTVARWSPPRVTQ